MAHIAVDLEITRLDTGFFQRRYHGWRNLRRKQPVAATQDVQHLGFDLCEIGPRVETEQRAPQDDQRMRIPVPCPIGSLLTDRRLALGRIGIARCQIGLDAIALQRLDPDLGQHRLAAGLSVIAPATPFRVCCEARLELGELLVGIDRSPRRGIDRHDRVHEVGVGNGLLKRLISAIRGASDRDEMLDPERVEQRLLRGYDVADADRRKIRTVRFAGWRVEARRICRAKGRAQHIRGDDEQFIGIDRLAGTDQPVPRARLVAIGRIAAGGMMTPGIAMRNQNGVAPAVWSIRGRETAIGFVDDCRLGHDRAVRDREIAQREKLVVNRADILGPQRRRVVHRDLPSRLRQLCTRAATGQWVANSPWETALAGTGAAALISPNAEANAALRGQVQVLAVLSQAEIPLPDPVAYRRDWATYRVRLTFGTPPSELESRELAAPAPPPQPAAPPPTPVPSG